ncbi:hypothetical protein A2767_00345 [Candidatus Roizmanbacteria bacterium RIFCSPHIGHO2_01_FULL_35_10]|uniref:Aspartyl/glutamyl-tRNA(Asn/Gln) amidotransferase subunit C n=1 Tax=Candidatus Roizmanbacteria bacterium RIFCSPLOWO2_01_FULL_35_13 TaxID=1802055 RepID=A0A1F7IHK5_9BACT|nr:MAG: hypothetical protein A2767_00345 [Candidatus Roizmanbacteria bacterium RIFCSPHIGHO2_01_FULL_35_10]OGK42795.1 MAG: hypothetical protein A3A74_01115 [Candidatus Roizmanbacteria bacterium RIFCSPLOWO2_01_FULL_35_13]
MKKKVLTKEDILHLAKLSNLKLSDEEIEKYLKQLEETVEYVKNLDELKTDKVSPTSQTTNLTDVYFADGETNERGLKLKEKYFIVKRIM